MDVDVGVLLELGQAIERNEQGDVELARLNLEDAGVVVDDLVPLDAVELGQAFLPVVRVALEDHDLVAPPLLEPERAGADRVLGERVALLLDHLLRQDRGREHRERGEERRRRLGQRDRPRCARPACRSP